VDAIQHCENLVNLNLKGNPVCSVEGYEAKIREWFPNLRVLDGKRIDERFLDRKYKRQLIAKLQARDAEREAPVVVETEEVPPPKKRKKEPKVTVKEKKKKVSKQVAVTALASLLQ
jgi:hypothetical protein